MGQGKIGSSQSGVLGFKSCNVGMPVFSQIQVVSWVGAKFSPLVRREVSESVRSRSVRLSM